MSLGGSALVFREDEMMNRKSVVTSEIKGWDIGMVTCTSAVLFLSCKISVRGN